MLFQAVRPILLNGIDDVIGRSDLADRALFLTLQPIADRRRRMERQLWCEFEVARPRILGSLLDAAAHGLRNVAGIHLEELPRMADFALWACVKAGGQHLLNCELLAVFGKIALSKWFLCFSSQSYAGLVAIRCAGASRTSTSPPNASNSSASRASCGRSRCPARTTRARAWGASRPGTARSGGSHPTGTPATTA